MCSALAEQYLMLCGFDKKKKKNLLLLDTKHHAKIKELELSMLMQPSKTTLNLPSSSLHLCSPLKEIRRVKIHHQFTSFPK